MAVSKRTRFEVLRRDSHRCRYCGASAPDATLTIDHVIPTALGGTDTPDNLVTACRECNTGKSSSTSNADLVQDVKDDSIRWSKAMQMAADRARQERNQVADYGMAFEEEWYGYYGYKDWHLPAGWVDSVEGFHRAGLTIDDLKHALATSMSKDYIPPRMKFRYMCGVAWGMLRSMQEEARSILNEEGDENGA